ncbi:MULTISPECIES: hypothetical protein [Chryseobacterium]|jgi:hypothetical protein|uniref:Uncharacterized protein n=1 Tax=Chryseobacterium geocarposphaerae TaxID=1416776 RepID=A0A2M9C9W7_9FLAO|nr:MULTISPECIES: hypothetical protein [Chryseobacterium]MPS65622.1 hypothetical protein [Chryseobacterium sp.]PJJ67610.1 hypothetical protein CLV73_1625 [Chryseobacterium geocarposphaerae]PZU16098.1 MAG: hypothetical protein DI622_11925 [Chryseobacterium sp.]UMQ43588.1 hypothetical protein MKS83_07765 [Chryseobacterium sp. Y16C]WEK71523.1 MAG: hypothetical protein P0Y62_08135 [Chryseobacterium sp.]
MQKFYKVFLIVFVIIIGINVYAIDFNTDLLSEDNLKFVFSIGAGVIGLILLFVMNTWSKIGVRK